MNRLTSVVQEAVRMVNKYFTFLVCEFLHKAEMLAGEDNIRDFLMRIAIVEQARVNVQSMSSWIPGGWLNLILRILSLAEIWKEF